MPGRGERGKGREGGIGMETERNIEGKGVMEETGGGGVTMATYIHTYILHETFSGHSYLP